MFEYIKYNIYTEGHDYYLNPTGTEGTWIAMQRECERHDNNLADFDDFGSPGGLDDITALDEVCDGAFPDTNICFLGHYDPDMSDDFVFIDDGTYADEDWYLGGAVNSGEDCGCIISNAPDILFPTIISSCGCDSDERGICRADRIICRSLVIL